MANGLRKAVGAKVVHEKMPEDLAASLAAGDTPDVFRVTRNELDRYTKQGLILDLSPYRDKLDDYTKFVGKDTVDYGKIDGKLRAITPYQNNNNDYTYWVRKDWLDAVGMDVPTNAKEFRAVLKAFTEDDPDGNGRKDTFGLTGASPDNTFKPLWGAFGTPGPGKIYVDDSGRIRNSYQDEGMAKAIAYIADLQKSGYVDPDSYNLQPSDARDHGFQGTAGVMYMPWTSVVKEPAASVGKKADPKAKWVQINQLEQADGSPGMLPVSTNASTMYALPASLEGDDEKIQKIIDLINYVATPDGLRFAMWGQEGKHYKLDSKGKIKPLPARFDEENGLFFIYLLAGRKETPYLKTLFPDLMKYINVAHKQPKVTTWEEYVVTPEGYNQSEADRYVEEHMVQLLTGKKRVSDYPPFLQTLDSQYGYQKFVDGARKQLADVGTDG